MYNFFFDVLEQSWQARMVIFDKLFPELRGLSQQSDVGFITLMEQMRYCTVGSFYKNPKNPVWVMASETHLTGPLI